MRQYIALSRDIERYLRKAVGVRPDRLSQVYNGVDDSRFSLQGETALTPWTGHEVFVFGTVGRAQAVKDQLTLVRAFAALISHFPQARQNARLVIIGDGPLLPRLQELVEQTGLGDLVWLPGSRDDIPALMRAMDVFVLPSLSEGISNTILEAMASGLPVVATAVGGNPELVEAGTSGALVPAGDAAQLADTLARYWLEPALARQQGQAARKIIETGFSMQRMVDQYVAVYRKAL